MSAEQRDAEPLQPLAITEVFDGRPAKGYETLRPDVQRAADRAVMAIFELAFSLKSLTDAIGRLEAEARRPFDSGSLLTPTTAQH